MLFYLKNLSTQSVDFAEDPAAVSLAHPLPPLADKDAYSQWCFSPATDHAFFSAFEGVTSGVRISKQEYVGNEPYKLHGLIVDYDAVQAVEDRVTLAVDSPASAYKPTHFYQTYSRHLRGVWQFEKPVFLPPNRNAVRRFMQILEKELKLNKWASGFEQEALYQIHKYYASGGPWMPAWPDFRIESNLLHFWLFQACKDVRMVDSKVAIPLDRVQAEIEKRFPGRWTGAFEIGSRGVRVWDPSANDATVCQVTQDGFIVYNGDPKSFMTWKDVLGREFVEEFEADRVAPILESTVWVDDKQLFYVRKEDSSWQPYSSGGFAQYLRNRGFDGRIPRNATHSEIDTVEGAIREKSQVVSARPFVHYPAGILKFNGERMLNIATARVVEPAPPGEVFGYDGLKLKCPKIHGFLSTFFDDPEGVSQMEYFLAWLKHFYVPAWKQRPAPGQALVISGPTNCGKSFLVDCILNKLMGGLYDAKDYIVNASPWMNFLFYPVAKVDDSEAAADERHRSRYVAVLKALVSNERQTVNTKYGAVGSVLWNGRVIVNTNLDVESRQMIPSMEMGNSDKIMLFKVKRGFEFCEEKHENEEWVERELPYLARFLIEWKIPQHLISTTDSRYRVRAYKHPDMLIEAVQAGSASSLWEILHCWATCKKEALKADPTANQYYWEGYAVPLLQEMLITDSLRALVSKYNTVTFPRQLAQLASRGDGKHGTGITCRQLGGRYLFRIPYSIFDGTYTPELDGEGGEHDDNPRRRRIRKNRVPKV